MSVQRDTFIKVILVPLTRLGQREEQGSLSLIERPLPARLVLPGLQRVLGLVRDNSLTATPGEIRTWGREAARQGPAGQRSPIQGFAES